MKLVIRPRRSGKTTAAVEWVKQGRKTKSFPGWSRVMITHDARTAGLVRSQYGLDENQVFAIDQWSRGARNVEIVIDNLDLIVERILAYRLGPLPIAFATWDEGSERD
ncbi:hypothetical protein ORV05_04730 [Amycolatopsis cynarae]|uniref:Uncharacterized protein n=1 Tax=Amycolatopsis cynarae TaxID=2995223 RepID=A0ABY7B8A1_9PSEU|nr:hypothetical protein [Amycolatopsis sp. HUAS 11-8]WAL67096.1 hypothetical protein ORV05_04730 [Amycolatopsis sp. HUAS 11-8]